MEESENFKKQFMLKCPVCGNEFYPWKSFGIISSETDWKESFYCPNCQHLDDKENYRNTYLGVG